MGKSKETTTASKVENVSLSDAEKETLYRQRNGNAAHNIKADSALPSVLEYASATERVVLVVGCLCCVVGGALNPLLTVRARPFHIWFVALQGEAHN